MPDWLLIVLLLLLGAIGVSYGLKCRELSKMQEEIEYPIPEYTPVLHLFCWGEGKTTVLNLFKLAMDSYAKASINIKRFDENNDLIRVEYKNGDILICFRYGADAGIKERELIRSTPRLFIDEQLPDSAERALKKQLGLYKYVIPVGYIIEKGFTDER